MWGFLLGGLSDCEELVGGYSQEMMGMPLPRVLVFEVVNASIMGRVTPFKFLKFQKLLGYPNVEVHTSCNFPHRSGYSSIPW